MLLHIVFDFIAIIAALLTNFFFRQQFQIKHPASLPEEHRYTYLLILIVGMVGGSILFGTLNIRLAGIDGFAKSLLGGIAGAIFLTEIFKKITKIKGSTGFYFVPGLCVLIIIGRIGCYLAGLPDFTYGIETNLPWGVDFGDNIKRHPVQLYESLSMLLFLVVLVVNYRSHQQFLMTKGFYLFVMFYAGQRFLWELLKPYPTLIGPFNLFHLLSVVLILYALFMLRSSKQNA